jgi:hypothetical protein
VFDRPDHIAASPSQRAREALVDDAERSNREIAIAVRATTDQVASVRRALTDLGVLAPQREPRRSFPQHVPLPRQPWLAEGACVGHPGADAWTEPRHPDREAARMTCLHCCPVQRTCLDWALAAVPASDVALYGGATAAQRARLRRQRGLERPLIAGIPVINAAKAACGNCGLPLSGENLVTEAGRRPGTYRRRCRACTRARKAQAYQDRRASRAAG